MWKTLAVTTALYAVALAPSLAQAAVTYTLTDQVYTFTDPNLPATTYTRPFDLSFSISDAAVARGSFNGSFIGLVSGNVITGDGADFIGAVLGRAPIGGNRTLFALSATFSGPDNIIISRLHLGSDDFDAEALFRGTGTSFSGAFTDGAHQGCGGVNVANPICNVSGQLVASVPEPMSLALLGVGLTGFAVARKRRA